MEGPEESEGVDGGERLDKKSSWVESDHELITINSKLDPNR